MGTALDFDEFRGLLEAERERLLRHSARYQRENSGSLVDELDESAGTDNLGDFAAATYDREFADGIEEGVADTLRQIDAALKRIEDGTYGVCEICGKPIGADRLRAIPWTTRCIDDQRR
ncbi:MAG TPA: TraR/DksA C4-type zinc finger protein [Gaiellaceae bacterium]